MQMMIVDIGSNTIKYDIFQPPCLDSIGHRSIAAGIIRYIENGVLTGKGLDTLSEVLLTYKQDADEKNIPLYAFATASLRRVKEPDLVIEEIKRRTGIEIELVSEEMESQLSLQGMLAATEGAKEGLMMDMGGGSTELNAFLGSSSLFSISCPFGALSLKNDFVSGEFPTASEADSIDKYASAVFSRYKDQIQTDTLYMVGGSAKATAKLIRHIKTDTAMLSYTPADFEAVLHTFLSANEENYALLKVMFPDRYHVMIPAVIAYVALLRCCGAKAICVSTGGVREGYLKHILKEGTYRERK